MRSEYLSYVTLLLTATVISFTLAFHAWRRRPAPGFISFVALTISIGIWSASYAMELVSLSLSNKILWGKASYIGIVFTPIAWFIFSFQYTKKANWLSRRNLSLLLVVPFITLMLTWTNELHGLIWMSNELGKIGSLSVRVFTFGAWFWIHAAYSYLLLFLGTFQLFKSAIRSPHFYRGQIVPLLVAVVAPWLGNILFIYGLSPIPNLDITPFGFTLTGLALAWSLFRHHLLDIMPIAREAVIEDMNDGVIVLDIQDRIVDINPAAKRIFGNSFRLIGQTVATLMGAKAESIQPYLTHEKHQTEILMDQENERHHFELRISPLHDKHKNLTGRLMILRDITEEKQAEEFLKNAHDKLEVQVHLRTLDLLEMNKKLKQEIQEREHAEQALKDSLLQIGLAKREWESTVDSLPQFICLLDRQGKVLRTNRTIEKWKIGQVEQVKGREVHDLIHPECTDSSCYLKSFWTRAWKAVADCKSYEYETKDLPLNRHLRFHIHPITATTIRKGEETNSFAILIIDDLTEQKEAERERSALEEQFRQAQKIEAIGRLTGGIAHDFNNLLTPIVGYAQMATTMLSPSDPLREDLQEIQKAAERASTLIRQLMTFSRKKPHKPQTLNLNAILMDMGRMIRRIIGENIELITLPAQDLGTVKVDPGLFEQVLINLVVNARDAMPSGGKLILETANVTFDQNNLYGRSGITPGQYVMCAVSDTGIGMTEEVKNHLFEPFFTTKAQGQGTGLGLSTVYGIVKESKGYILVYSEPGQGTTFKIYLPLVEEEATSLPRRDEDGYMPRGNETILLVEDEPMVRTFTSRVLRDQGYRVLEAENGLEALKLAKEYGESQIHLLLTDVVMPQMGGKELADQIVNMVRGIRVLFTSGYTDNVAIQHGLLNSDIAFIEKPFTPFSLTRKVREVLDR